MSKTKGQLKQRLRGVKELKKALTTLRYTAWAPPGDDSGVGYVIGTNDFIEYVAHLILEDLKVEEVAEEEEAVIEDTTELMKDLTRMEEEDANLSSKV